MNKNRCKRTLGSTFAAADNKSGHLGKFSINEKAGKSGGRTPDKKATEGYFISNPLFNMLLSLPSSIKTNDLSCARHQGAKPWSCFPERRGVMDFHMPKLFEMLMKQGKQTRGEPWQTPASLRRMQRCRRKNDAPAQPSGSWWTVRKQRCGSASNPSRLTNAAEQLWPLTSGKGCCSCPFFFTTRCQQIRPTSVRSDWMDGDASPRFGAVPRRTGRIKTWPGAAVKGCIFNEHQQIDLLLLKWRSGSNARGVRVLRSY